MRRLFTLWMLILLAGHRLSAQISPEALQQWENRKYSMFIHWGIYAELGGVWDGKQISRGLSEQIQAHAGIYSDTYAQVAKRFHPVKWNPDSIALLAKHAGMRSIVITSKHHDGFCMFHSKYTGFNVVDATPYKRDVLKDLSEACARHGLKFGLYFSLIDWHYPQASPISSHNSDYITPEHFEFNKNQITELLTNYGPVSELWFDMGSHSFEQSLEMRNLVHSLQPDCMIGSRLGNDMSDFMVMGDNQEPDYIIGAPWQSPASFFHETWGYRSWQERGNEADKIREKLTSLIRVCSRGGNYLLNIGPRGDGSVVEFEQRVLLEIGRWLDRNGEAIYGASADPFHVPFEWGAITSRSDKLYLHVLAQPKDGNIVLPGLNGKIRNASVLADGTPCTCQKDRNGITVKLPATVDPAREFKVIELAFEGGYTVPPVNIVPYAKDLTLDQHNAFKYYSNSGVDYNSRYQSVVREEWTLLPGENTKRTPVLYYTDEEKGRTIDLNLDGQTVKIALETDTEVKLKNNIAGMGWGPIYLQGPLPSGIGGIHGESADIDPTQPWGRAGKAWERTSWKNNETYVMPGDLTQAWYMLQEITSPVDQQILVSVTSADAVTALLNGEILVLHNNPYKKENMQDVALLDLKKGKNQLLVKCFSNFQKEVRMGIATHVPQHIYVKKLEPVKFRKGKYFPVNWKLGNPVTPHETLHLPNLRLKFE
ncbi:MAG: alpha-L-fucosidase [Bacteroidales bacterium]|nr:alpha-L-fucosidase [Bacteroidales bacterium]